MMFPNPGPGHAAYSGGGGGGPTLLASLTEKLPSPPDITSAIDTTGANLIVLITSHAFGDSLFNDSKSNAYTNLSDHDDGAFAHLQFHYVFNPTVGSGHTFTRANGSALTVTVTAWNLIASSPLDQENNNPAGGAFTTLATGSITPSQANTLAIAGLAWNDASAVAVSSIDSGYTIIGNSPGGGGTIGLAAAYKVLSATTANNPVWTMVSSQGAGQASIVNFKY